MIVRYKFLNGDVTKVEVGDEKIYAEIKKSEKDEHANNERHRYHCYSSDAIIYEGLCYASKENTEDDAETEMEMTEEAKKRALKKKAFYLAFNTLTETQKRRLVLYASGVSARKIAKEEGVSHKSVLESIEAAKKKFKKNFNFDLFF